MKTIEQRAQEYAKGIQDWRIIEATKIGYIAGATEQREIDIDKACEWMEMAIEQWNDAERHRTFFIDKDGTIRNFRKAMKGE